MGRGETVRQRYSGEAWAAEVGKLADEVESVEVPHVPASEFLRALRAKGPLEITELAEVTRFKSWQANTELPSRIFSSSTNGNLPSN